MATRWVSTNKVPNVVGTGQMLRYVTSILILLNKDISPIGSFQ